MRFLMMILVAGLLSCQNKKGGTSGNTTYHETYRPQYHFSPPSNWTNDPNGLVYYNDEYHLFYQYNPYGDTWGHMTWGHAISRDLLHWENLPTAIQEYIDPASGDSTMIFSGTVVVDNNNTSGLCDGKDCLVAVYTSHVHAGGEGKRQHESLAFSNDRGRTWKLYNHNPVLDIGRKDFRDPKIFWYEPKKEWVMLVVIPDQYKVQFYRSSNLKEWTLRGSFGPLGDTLKIWECPDLYDLPIEGTTDRKWVLSLSGSHPAGPGFVGMQYFVGQFDGDTFRPDDPIQPPLYVEVGKDFYAGIIFNNVRAPVMVGWANNWTYARQTPTSPWRGAMSLPRALSLRKTSAGIRLVQKPVEQLATLRGAAIPVAPPISGKTLEIEIEIVPGTEGQAGVRVLMSKDEATAIGYDALKHELFVDRTHSGNIGFHPAFASVESVKLNPVEGRIKLHLFIDQSIVEVFANDGEQAISELIFPLGNEARVETFATDGNSSTILNAWEMKSVW